MLDKLDGKSGGGGSAREKASHKIAEASSTTPLVGSTTYSDIATAEGCECASGCFTSRGMGDLGDNDCTTYDDWDIDLSGAAAAAPSLPLPPRSTPPNEA